MKKKAFYWSPCLNPVGTVISTINSSVALSKYSKNFDVSIINACGEWDDFKDEFLKQKINVIDFKFKYFRFLPKTGFILSRISYFIIFLFSLLPLFLLIKKQKPNFLIAHLITSLPIFIFKIFKLDSSLMLRISGMPHLNFLRKKFWQIGAIGIKIVTCPSLELKEKLENLKIFNKDKIEYLPDAIINMEKFRKQLKNKNLYKNIFSEDVKVFLAAGRLTKQKNFSYLIDEFTKFFIENKNYRLVILGDGEEFKFLKKKIYDNQLTNIVHLTGRVDNVLRYMKDSDAFILSSRWEEMGFVIIEAALSNLFIISSNCPNGPTEFLNDGRNGILFENNQKDALLKSLKKFDTMNKETKKNDCLKLKKNSQKFTMFRHSSFLIKILNSIN